MSAPAPILAIGPASLRTEHQVKTYGPKRIGKEIVTAVASFDDRCNNGRNTFAITATVVDARSGEYRGGGAVLGLIAEQFPELAPYTRWHLCSTDGPMHYVENAMYWLGRRGSLAEVNGPPRLAAAREVAIWPEMPASLVVGCGMSDAAVERALKVRLPRLLAEFRAAVESLGMVW